MHELSLCEALIDTARRQLDARPEYAGRRLKSLKVSIGALSGCEPDLLARLFPHASPGTVAEGAELIVDFQPARVACEACGTERDVAANQLVCPQCGDTHVRLVAGDDVLLTGMTLTDG